MLKKLSFFTVAFSMILVAGCANKAEQPAPRTQTIYVYPAQGNNNKTPDQWTDYKPYKPQCAAKAKQK